MDIAERTIVGLTEEVEIKMPVGFKKSVKAKIDTGADKSSIDEAFAGRLGLGPIEGYKTIKQASGNKKRAFIRLKIKITGKIIEAYFTLADRKHLKYKMLIGKNVLKHNFLIDPMKK